MESPHLFIDIDLKTGKTENPYITELGDRFSGYEEVLHGYKDNGYGEKIDYSAYSPVDILPKFTKELADCISIITWGIDTETQQPLSFLTHIKPSNFAIPEIVTNKLLDKWNAKNRDSEIYCSVMTNLVRISPPKFTEERQKKNNKQIDNLVDTITKKCKKDSIKMLMLGGVTYDVAYLHGYEDRFVDNKNYEKLFKDVFCNSYKNASTKVMEIAKRHGIQVQCIHIKGYPYGKKSAYIDTAGAKAGMYIPVDKIRNREASNICNKRVKNVVKNHPYIPPDGVEYVDIGDIIPKHNIPEKIKLHYLAAKHYFKIWLNS